MVAMTPNYHPLPPESEAPYYGSASVEEMISINVVDAVGILAILSDAAPRCRIRLKWKPIRPATFRVYDAGFFDDARGQLLRHDAPGVWGSIDYRTGVIELDVGPLLEQPEWRVAYDYDSSPKP